MRTSSSSREQAPPTSCASRGDMTQTVDAPVQTDASTEPANGLEQEPASPAEQPAVQGDTQPTTSVDEPRTFSWDVDGQVVELTEDEARNGYLRRADYTRKTQEVAAERERLAAAEKLWSALQEDPASALSA